MPQENYTEKVSVNINTSTLSEIDLLVDNGYYSNRSDFINQAVREALGRQRGTIDGIVRRQEERVQRGSWFIGVSGFTAKEIVRMHAEGETVSMTGYGVLHIDPACDREQLYQVVESIRVRGKVIAPADVKAHYGLK
jgi:Arc/MetJ-type ribon-helix-helix transcriptional regulator